MPGLLRADPVLIPRSERTGRKLWGYTTRVDPSREDTEAHRAERTGPGHPAQRGRARTQAQVLRTHSLCPMMPWAEQIQPGQ